MGTLGNQPNFGAYGFTRTQAESFNGTGSATSFTLGHHVKNAIDIEVLVDNVQQSPFDGSYSVSGTTLTFSGAPASGTNNVYVMYRQVGTVIDTQALVPDDSSVTYAKLGNDIPFSNRNLIINGEMNVWQRGTSHDTTGGIVYTADRFWKYSPSISGTYERSTDAPDGFAYSMHYNVDGNTAGSGTSVEFTRQGYFPLQTYTFSFYVKGDLTNTNLDIGYRNSVGSGTDQVAISQITDFGNYTDWTRVERTFTINTAPHANNKFLNLEFATMPAGVKFTGVQLEVGSKATPFEHRSYGDELAKCQRYYQKFPGPLQIPAYQDGSTGANASLKLSPNMRSTTPSIASDGSLYIWRHNGYQSQENPAITPLSISGSNIILSVGGYSGGVNGYVANLYISNLEVSNEL